MRTPQYFRRGEQITAADALDERGLLRDGVTMRTSMMLRDAASTRDRLVDGNGSSDPLAFSKPGFRQLADASVNDERQSAYATYLHDLQTAWMGDKKKKSVDPD